MNIQTNSITFKEILKLVHPDVNPDLENTTDKLNEILRFKTNEGVLYRLALDWGLVERVQTPVNKPSVNRWNSNISYKRKIVKERVIEIGSTIFIKTLNEKGVVTRTTDKRYYFVTESGRKSFCQKLNAVLV